MEELRNRIIKTPAVGRISDALLNAPIAIAVLEGPDFTLTYANQAILKFWGKDERVIGKKLLEVLPEIREQSFPEILRNVLITGKGFNAKEAEAFLNIDGQIKRVYCDFSYSAIQDEQGVNIAILVVASDVTDRVMTDKVLKLEGGIPTIENLKEKRAMLAAIVDSSEDTIVSKTLEGIITSWNPSAERMFGYTEAEAIGEHISMLIPEERLQEEDYIISNVRKGVRVEHFETQRKTKNGRLIDISLTVSPIRDNEGVIIGASKIARDITEQRKNQRRLTNYSESLEAINKLCQTISEELNLEKLLQKVTDVATEVSGANFGAFFYNSINEQGEAYMLYNVSGAPLEHFSRFGMPRNTAIFHPTFAGEGVVRVDDITLDERYGKSAPHYGMPKGHLPVKSYLAVPVISKAGEVVGGIFLGHPEAAMFTEDHENIVVAVASQAAIAIDNAKLFEEVRLLNAKKDEFIGLASHELRTPLTSMTAYLQILQRTKLEENQKTFLQKTISQTQKLTSLVNDILDVSKIEAGKLQFSFQANDLTQIITDCVELVQLSISSHKIVADISKGNIEVLCDRHRVEQVIINLLTNAVKYSPKAEIVEVLLADDHESVKVGVRDYGLGIPKDKISHLFSRFYRVENLSPTISGLGIGLYITKEIVTRHNGKIWVETEEGQGSTFWFTLPKNPNPL
ncbi:PAS domain S-box protein [Desertivirga brevis]|uniref:PAS domain S-box protein n=1 Tax=Desertivirga brevis TaxID=2810310 RepID=UPI001A95CA15|nr:PAS domain S-box protein [Pedobacter sp. SYSU D00873]